MADRREIQPGESLLQLAYEAGLDSWRRIWDDEANAELRSLRKDPQVLLPGDPVTVPTTKTQPKESCPVDKIHRFQLARPRAWVNLRMLDGSGEPLAGRRYELRIETRVYVGTTDEDGMVSAEIRPNAHEGWIKLWLDGPDPAFEAAVKVGYLDPATEPSGQHARLVNLGAERILSARRSGAAVAQHPRSALFLFSSEDLGEAVDSELADYLESRHDRKD